MVSAVSRRATRLVLALTASESLHTGSMLAFLRQPRSWRSLSSKTGSNPFEIDLNQLKMPTSTTATLTLDDAKVASALQQADAQDEIDLLHNEMSKLFGGVAEYRGDSLSSSEEEAMAAFDEQYHTRKDGMVVPEDDIGSTAITEQSEQSPMLTTKGVRPDGKHKEKQIVSLQKSKSEGNCFDHSPVDVLLLQGPCSFVQGVWTGGDVEKETLWQQVQTLADNLKIAVKCHNYDSEKAILEKILNARADQVIVLYWNISLSKSPFIVHALELIRSKIIIVSPNIVEHGPLPVNVVGVLSGFRNQSFSLALNAAANLRGASSPLEIRRS